MTRLIVLGLLSEKPMSGYDIQQSISDRDAERWGGVLIGSIYHALKKLEKEQQIEVAGVEQTGHRQKTVYQITDQGRNYLQSLVIDSLRTTSVSYPTTLYSGLSLLDKIPREAAIKALKAQKDSIDQEYEAIIEKNRGNEESEEEISEISQLTIDNMFAIVEQQRHYIECLLKVLAGE